MPGTAEPSTEEDADSSDSLYGRPPDMDPDAHTAKQQAARRTTATATAAKQRQRRGAGAGPCAGGEGSAHRTGKRSSAREEEEEEDDNDQEEGESATGLRGAAQVTIMELPWGVNPGTHLHQTALRWSSATLARYQLDMQAKARQLLQAQGGPAPVYYQERAGAGQQQQDSSAGSEKWIAAPCEPALPGMAALESSQVHKQAFKRRQLSETGVGLQLHQQGSGQLQPQLQQQQEVAKKEDGAQQQQRRATTSVAALWPARQAAPVPSGTAAGAPPLPGCGNGLHGAIVALLVPLSQLGAADSVLAATLRQMDSGVQQLCQLLSGRQPAAAAQRAAGNAEAAGALDGWCRGMAVTAALISAAYECRGDAGQQGWVLHAGAGGQHGTAAAAAAGGSTMQVLLNSAISLLGPLDTSLLAGEPDATPSTSTGAAAVAADKQAAAGAAGGATRRPEAVVAAEQHLRGLLERPGGVGSSAAEAWSVALQLLSQHVFMPREVAEAVAAAPAQQQARRCRWLQGPVALRGLFSSLRAAGPGSSSSSSGDAARHDAILNLGLRLLLHASCSDICGAGTTAPGDPRVSDARALACRQAMWLASGGFEGLLPHMDAMANEWQGHAAGMLSLACNYSSGGGFGRPTQQASGGPPAAWAPLGMDALLHLPPMPQPIAAEYESSDSGEQEVQGRLCWGLLVLMQQLGLPPGAQAGAVRTLADDSDEATAGQEGPLLAFQDCYARLQAHSSKLRYAAERGDAALLQRERAATLATLHVALPGWSYAQHLARPGPRAQPAGSAAAADASAAPAQPHRAPDATPALLLRLQALAAAVVAPLLREGGDAATCTRLLQGVQQQLACMDESMLRLLLGPGCELLQAMAEDALREAIMILLVGLS